MLPMNKLNDCIEKASEAWLSCMIFMVQGDLASLTVKHALTALQTSMGVLIAYAACQTLLRKQSVAFNAFLGGVVTTFIDLRVHPTHFGPFWAEAAATGAGVTAMAFLLHIVKRKLARS